MPFIPALRQEVHESEDTVRSCLKQNKTPTTDQTREKGNGELVWIASPPEVTECSGTRW
jgi:hypothetical protein